MWFPCYCESLLLLFHCHCYHFYCCFIVIVIVMIQYCVHCTQYCSLPDSQVYTPGHSSACIANSDAQRTCNGKARERGQRRDSGRCAYNNNNNEPKMKSMNQNLLDKKLPATAKRAWGKAVYINQAVTMQTRLQLVPGYCRPHSIRIGPPAQ